MGLFSKSTKLNSDEYEKLTNKFIDLNSQISDLKNKIDILTTNYNSLRGLFNRRLNKEEEEEEFDIDSEVLNRKILLSDHGLPFKNR